MCYGGQEELEARMGMELEDEYYRDSYLNPLVQQRCESHATPHLCVFRCAT